MHGHPDGHCKLETESAQWADAVKERRNKYTNMSLQPEFNTIGLGQQRIIKKNLLILISILI